MAIYNYGGLPASQDNSALAGAPQTDPTGASNKAVRPDTTSQGLSAAEMAWRQRQVAFDKRWKAYNGETKPILKVKKGEPNDNVKTNRIKLIADKSVSFLFGKGFKISLDDDETSQSQEEQYLQEILEANEQAILFEDLGLNGAICGHAFLQIIPADPYPELVVLDPATVDVAHEPDNIRKIVGFRIQYQIQQQNMGYTTYRKTIRKIGSNVFPTSKDIGNLANGGPSGGSPSNTDLSNVIAQANARSNSNSNQGQNQNPQAQQGQDEEGDGDSYIGEDFNDQFGEPTWEIIEEVKRNENTKSGEANRAYWEVIAEPSWPYDWPPIIECKNQKNPNNFWGSPDITDEMIDLMRSINTSLSLWNRILRINSAPRTYAVGIEADRIDIAADGMMVLPAPANGMPAPSLGVLQTTPTGATYLQDLYKTLREAMHEQGMVPEIATGKVDNLGALSGVALQILYQPLIEKTNSKRNFYKSLIVELCRRLLELGGHIKAEERAKTKVNVVWPDPLPANGQEERQNAQIDLTLGLASKATIATQLGYDWQIEKQKIDAEQDETQQRNQANMEAQMALQAKFAKPAGSEPTEPSDSSNGGVASGQQSQQPTPFQPKQHNSNSAA